MIMVGYASSIMVISGTVQLEQCVSDNTRQSQIHKADNLQRCAQQSTLLCFLQILCGEYACTYA